MSANVDTIGGLMRSFEEQDIEKTLTFFNADAVWNPIPMDVVAEGIGAIRDALGSTDFRPSKVEFVVHNAGENPESNVVMNERTERCKNNEGWLATRVMGVFHIKDGKVQQWRDRFDLAEMEEHLGQPS